ncbi:MAG: discoidin domain-containing protein, partial [Clostridia bacterium]|nr:discoidin domain-containing protein [Clostridia bacterium]
GRSLSLREIAATMIELGCNNVIRMDGGGSSAMYTSNVDGSGNPGYLYVSEDRAVADCILIVKKTSAQDADLNTALKAAIASAKESVATTPNATLSAYIAEAEALVASGVVLESDALRLIASLSGKGELRDLIKRASGISYKEYSESVLSVIREAYNDAIDAYFGSDATAKDIADICATLSESLDNSAYKNLSKGKKYTTTKPDRGDDFDDDGARLTDGSKSNAEGGSPANYSGWGATTKSVDVIVDLGSKQNSNTYTVYGASNFWGISAINSLKVSVSNDGSSFTEVGSSSEASVVGSGVEVDGSTITLSAITVKADEIQNARYVKLTVSSPKFVWIDEVEVAIGGDTTGKTVGDAVEVHGFNSYVYDSDCYIYTPDFGELTATKINHRYTTNVILEATDKADEWKVVSVVTNNGTAAKITLEENQIMIACHSGLTSASKTSVEILKKAKAGQTLVLYGIDVANKNIGVAAYIQLKGGSGDVNNDGTINQYDYILVKRHYFGTRLLTDDEMSRADANADGTVNQFDYILICRHYFGTYVIGG